MARHVFYKDDLGCCVDRDADGEKQEGERREQLEYYCNSPGTK